MGRFQDWLRNQKGFGVRTPDDFTAYWNNFEATNWETFASYRRYIAREGASPADVDPATLVANARAALAPAPVPGAAPPLPVPAVVVPPVIPAAAGPPVPAAAAGPPAPNNAMGTLAKALDTLSDRIFTVADIERQRERVEVFVQREQIAQARIPAAAPGQPQGTCTVRLQVQTNYKMSGGKDTLATVVVDNPLGVSGDSVDEAFERLVLAAHLANKLEAQMREAYSIHRSSWHTYMVGGSNSVYFDESKITTAGRPRGGYRLDLENVRVAPGRQNFL